MRYCLLARPVEGQWIKCTFPTREKQPPVGREGGGMRVREGECKEGGLKCCEAKYSKKLVS